MATPQLAIRAQELAGLDLLTDGEIRRESYSNHFATALEGVDVDNPGTALDRSGHPNPVPRIVGPIHRPHPVQVRDLEFLRAHTTRPVKMTVPPERARMRLDANSSMWTCSTVRSMAALRSRALRP